MKRKQQATTSGEDYLEAILVLQMQKGTVRSVDVARHMEVSKPSVSHAVATLRDGGFLTMDSQSVEMMRVLFDVFSIKFARHHAVRPSRVKQHDWQEDQRHKEHDLKRELGAGAVPKRQTGIEHR